jgi:hypothetical protein
MDVEDGGYGQERQVRHGQDVRKHCAGEVAEQMRLDVLAIAAASACNLNQAEELKSVS